MVAVVDTERMSVLLGLMFGPAIGGVLVLIRGVFACLQDAVLADWLAGIHDIAVMVSGVYALALIPWGYTACMAAWLFRAPAPRLHSAARAANRHLPLLTARIDQARRQGRLTHFDCVVLIALSLPASDLLHRTDS